MPALDGRLAVVTGASGGLGREVARVLASKKANVVVAARSLIKGAAAVAEIGEAARFETLDLANLRSVHSFAARLHRQARPIDILINNAGLLAPRKRAVTHDGFEVQFGTNFLGHFALTALLLPLLRASAKPRVINVSSLVERSAKIDWTNILSERTYSPTRAYAQSKLANLLFSRELQRRSDINRWGLLSIGAHPGIAITELTESRPGQPPPKLSKVFRFLWTILGHSVHGGALPILYAATARDAEGGGYYGPQGFMEMKGPPGAAQSSEISQSPEVAARLWEIAEALTGIRFPQA